MIFLMISFRGLWSSPKLLARKHNGQEFLLDLSVPGISLSKGSGCKNHRLVKLKQSCSQPCVRSVPLEGFLILQVIKAQNRGLWDGSLSITLLSSAFQTRPTRSLYESLSEVGGPCQKDQVGIGPVTRNAQFLLPPIKCHCLRKKMSYLFSKFSKCHLVKSSIFKSCNTDSTEWKLHTFRDWYRSAL